MRLLLTSQGLRNRGASLLVKKFLNDLKQAPVVGYIPNAKPKLDVKRLKTKMSKLQRMGCNVVLMDLRYLKGKKLRERLEEINVIFVGGGNVFYLLYMMRKSGLVKLLPKFLEKDKAYIGVSAGSYVASPTIEAGGWKPEHSDRNFIGIKNLKALNLVPFLITAHFSEKYRKVVENNAVNSKYPIVALYDTQAILVKNRSYKVLGSGKKEFFNGFAETRQ